MLRNERYFGNIYRSFTLPAELDESACEATYDNGVLELKLVSRPRWRESGWLSSNQTTRKESPPFDSGTLPYTRLNVECNILWTHVERVTIVKRALVTGINREMALRQARRNLHALDGVDDPARIRGGNWTMQGFRRSGPVCDESECQMSIAEFMADTRERYDIVE